ncbi:PKD domain-containing protein [Lentzea sp. NPDC005914]|uniref:PKD domain-containing protein n=1 Tax=Lentzea sp. NPDC005914 TaxID=3154572 RepID=UPI0033D805B1
MKALTRKRLLGALAVVVTTAAAVVVVGPGYHASRVGMRSGTVWLASSHTGEATLVDGAAAEVTARVQVAEKDTALTVAQRGSTAVVLNRETGQLSSVDGATEHVSPPVSVLPPSDGLVVLPAPDALYVVDVHSGLAAVADPGTLAPRGEPQRLAKAIRPGNVGVDGRGRLWVLDDTTGDLVWLDQGERRTRSAATKSGRLAITDGKPVLVDTDRGTAELIDPETGAVARSVRLDVRADDTTVIGGSADQARVLIATGSRGELVSCAFDAGCTEPVRVGAAGAELGRPIEVDNHAVVPDHSTGQATIVNLAPARVVAQRQLFDRPARFELIARDGIVFFNDPGGDAAGVLELSGITRTITKYTSTDDGATPTPGRPGQADQVTKAGQQKKPGLGLPGRTNQDVPPKLTPPATFPAAPVVASIVVTPGNRGVAGEEFELTMRLQPSGNGTTHWSFGDGTEADGTTVRHKWRQPSAYTVHALVTLDTGKQVRAETTVTVGPVQAPPRVAALNHRPAKPVMGQSVRFTADATGNPEKWAWSVTRTGQPTPEVTAQTPQFDHTFATPGTYTVALTITAGGQTAESSQQFTVARGAVKHWGDDHQGLLKVPEEASSGVVAIDAGFSHCVALKANGRVIVWGNDSAGELEVPERALSGVVAISAGWSQNLALRSDGTLVRWGAPRVKVPDEALTNVIAIAGGLDHSLVLKSDGRVIAWGDNAYGQTDVPDAALSGVVAIAAGSNHSLALKSDGTVIGWGTSDYHDLTVPPAATSGVIAIAAGAERSMVMKSDGSIIQWGSLIEGETPPPPAAQRSDIRYDMSYNHAVGLTADGSAVSWGHDRVGETAVPAEYDHHVLAVAAGADYSMVLLE